MVEMQVLSSLFFFLPWEKISYKIKNVTVILGCKINVCFSWSDGGVVL